MYGKGSSDFPRRIVCLSTEHVEICYAPEARDKPKVGGFTTFRLDKILGLEPDLVLAFSDLQADISAELVRAGRPVFCSNQRSVEEILGTILIAGGRDIFPELSEKPSAKERIVDPAEVIRRDPHIILASWCGKPVDVEAIRSRPGWAAISAVRTGRIHELDGADILSPGPSVMTGLRVIHEIVQQGLTG